MKFPQFRRYLNGRSYFRIDGPERVSEVQVLGNFYILHDLQAKILPDRVFISDLIEADPDVFELIDQESYDAFLAHNAQTRTLRSMGI